MSCCEQQKKAKIILHIGLPKTGTTALQRMLYENRKYFMSQGVLYPDLVNSNIDPKHNFLIHYLKKSFRDDFEKVFDKSYDRIVLSNESLSNDIYFYEESKIKGLAKFLSEYGDLEICLVTRNLEKWLKSYYKQSVINNSVKGKDHYQTSRLFKDFLEYEVVRKLTNHGEVIKDISLLFEAPIRVFRYEESTVQEIAEWCAGIKFPEEKKESKIDNESLPDAAVEVMRQLNCSLESKEEKYAWSKVLHQSITGQHEVLRALAGRASDKDVMTLDFKKLDLLKFAKNQPLIYSEEELKRIIVGMKSSLARLREIDEELNV